MIHGIGQRLEKSNLIDDVGNFRHITASLSERHLTSYQRGTQRILYIPCQVNGIFFIHVGKEGVYFIILKLFEIIKGLFKYFVTIGMSCNQRIVLGLMPWYSMGFSQKFQGLC